VDSPAVLVEALKKAEDGEALIVRLYEAHGTDTAVTLTFHIPVQRVDEANLMEEPLGRLSLEENQVVVRLNPFEVKTLRLTLEK
jgi:alpha-mannosidase